MDDVNKCAHPACKCTVPKNDANGGFCPDAAAMAADDPADHREPDSSSRKIFF